jgi:periplasmic divalent cation tolerance protein
MTKIVADPHLDLVADASAQGAAPTSGALSELVVLLCTFPTAESIGEVALTLVGENLCACVNILHEALSIYRWNDEIVTNKEVLCLIKTSRARHAELVERLTELHPYEVPEIVTLATSAVNQPYLQWVNKVTSGGSRSATSQDPRQGDGADENV